MSVDPVQGYSAGDAVSVAVQQNVRQSQSGVSSKVVVQTTASPNLGPSPEQDHSSANSAVAGPEFPQDEVQLQLDSQIKDQVIVKYTDKTTGEVILQVPSSQVLGVARGIYQDFQRETKARAVSDEAATTNQGGEHHGD